MAEGSSLILVADDDEDIVRFVEVNLRLEGYAVATASDGEQALARAAELRPALVLLDVMMPRLNGLEVCRRLRADPSAASAAVMMLTAKSLPVDKVVGLTAGADDYIVKPFDPRELVARVKTVLRRRRETHRLDPLTGLPGNVDVREELARRVGESARFAVLYVDLDNFKAYNDGYGFSRGDEAIKALAKCLSQALDTVDARDAFVGHIGGDDFLLVVDPEAAEAAAKEVCATWDRTVRDLYDGDDAERGFIEVTDRRNQVHRVPLATVSVGIASNAHRPIESHWEAAEIATEMKQFAKREQGSSFAADRRRGRAGGAAT
jgi:diguanylate cyclase (GGDEF)-like protein